MQEACRAIAIGHEHLCRQNARGECLTRLLKEARRVPSGHKSIHAALFFWGIFFFELLAVTGTAFNFRGIYYHSIRFEQVKCTLSGSYTVAVFNIWGLDIVMQAAIVT